MLVLGLVVLLGLGLPRATIGGPDDRPMPPTQAGRSLALEAATFPGAADLTIQVVVGGTPGDDVVSPEGLRAVRRIVTEVRRVLPPDRGAVRTWFDRTEAALDAAGRGGMTPSGAALDAMAVAGREALSPAAAARAARLTAGPDPAEAVAGVVLVRLGRAMAGTVPDVVDAVRSVDSPLAIGVASPLPVGDRAGSAGRAAGLPVLVLAIIAALLSALVMPGDNGRGFPRVGAVPIATAVGVLGAAGWLGPQGLGLLGPLTAGAVGVVLGCLAVAVHAVLRGPTWTPFALVLAAVPALVSADPSVRDLGVLVLIGVPVALLVSRPTPVGETPPRGRATVIGLAAGAVVLLAVLVGPCSTVEPGARRGADAGEGSDADARDARAAAVLRSDFGGGLDQTTSLVVGGPGVRDPAVHNALLALERGLAGVPGVAVEDGVPVVTSFTTAVQSLLETEDDGPGAGQVAAALAAARAAGLQPNLTIAEDGDVDRVYGALRTVAPGLAGVAAVGEDGRPIAVRIVIATPMLDPGREVLPLQRDLADRLAGVVVAGDVVAEPVSAMRVEQEAAAGATDARRTAAGVSVVVLAVLLALVTGRRERRLREVAVLAVTPAAAVGLAWGAAALVPWAADPVTLVAVAVGLSALWLLGSAGRPRLVVVASLGGATLVSALQGAQPGSSTVTAAALAATLGAAAAALLVPLATRVVPVATRVAPMAPREVHAGPRPVTDAGAMSPPDPVPPSSHDVPTQDGEAPWAPPAGSAGLAAVPPAPARRHRRTDPEVPAPPIA